MSMKLLAAATATGAGTAVSLRTGAQEHAVQANITGAPAAVTVALEASLDDGVTWVALVTHVFTAGELTATTSLFFVTGSPVMKVRANLVTLTAGAAPTVTVYYFPFEHRGG